LLELALLRHEQVTSLAEPGFLLLDPSDCQGGIPLPVEPIKFLRHPRGRVIRPVLHARKYAIM